MISVSILEIVTTEYTKDHKQIFSKRAPRMTKPFVSPRGLCVETPHPPASNRRASMGSTDAARRAGYSDETTAIVPSIAVAISPDLHVGSKPAKKSGMGSRLTSAQIP